MASIELSLPLTLTIDLTGPTDQPLNLQTWKRIIDSNAGFLQEVEIIAGTSSGREALLELLELLDRAAVDTVLHLTGPWADAAGWLKGFDASSHLICLVFPLHGADGPTHQVIAPADDYDALLEAIRQAVLWNHQVRLEAVLGRHNLAQLEQLAQLCSSLECTRLTFLRYLGPVDRRISLSRDDTSDALNRIEALAQEGWAVGADSAFPPCFHETISRGCACGNTSAAVKADGHLRLCRHQEAGIADLSRQSLSKAWTSRAARRWRSEIPAECKNCRFFLDFKCFGGCRYAAGLNGSPEDPLMVKDFVREAPTLDQEIDLDEDLCPIPRYVRRDESFGSALIRDGGFMPVRKDAQPLLAALDGNTDLHSLHERFGPEAVSFIFNLYLRNLVTFHYSEQLGGVLPDPRTPPPRIMESPPDDPPFELNQPAGAK